MVQNLAISDIQLKRFFLWTLALAAVAVAMMMPELAFAETGDTGLWGKGAADIKKESAASFKAWWDVASTWMLWIGLGALCVSVILFKGTGWYVALIIWAIAAWGDKIVEWVDKL